MPRLAVKFPSEPPPTDASSSFQPNCFAISEAFLYSIATPALRSMGGRFTPPVISSLHLRLKGSERSELAVDHGSVFHAGHSHVQRGGGLGGNHIGASAAGDQANIQGEAALDVDEFGDGDDLLCQFDNGALAFVEIKAGVSRFPDHFQSVFAHALAGRLHGSLRPVRGFKNQHRRGFSGQTFGDARGKNRCPPLRPKPGAR